MYLQTDGRMIKVSAMRPDLRAKTINSWREELAYEKQPKIDAWGLQVGRAPVIARNSPISGQQQDGRDPGSRPQPAGHQLSRPRRQAA